MAARNAEDKIKEFRAKLEETKREMNILEGEKKSYLKRLKDEYGLSSLEEASAEEERLSKEEMELEKALQEKVSFIETNYSFE